MFSYQILNYDYILRIEIMNKTKKKREEILLSSLILITLK
jgi:hypothetical protein